MGQFDSGVLEALLDMFKMMVMVDRIFSRGAFLLCLSGADERPYPTQQSRLSSRFNSNNGRLHVKPRTSE